MTSSSIRPEVAVAALATKPSISYLQVIATTKDAALYQFRHTKRKGIGRMFVWIIQT
jgi:hypothetical protein